MTIYSRQNPPEGFYVYAYLREDGTPYYIGKGKGIRAWAHARRERIHGPGDQSRIEIISHCLTEDHAHLLEIQLISEYGRRDNNTGILHNITSGGEGQRGRIVSQLTRERLSKSLKGKVQSAEHRKKNSLANTGKPKSKQAIQKRKESIKGYVRPVDINEKISTSLKRLYQEKQYVHKGKTYDEIYGPEEAERKREKLRGIKGPRSKATKKHDSLTCPHCGKSGGQGNMKRYHFSKCALWNSDPESQS